MKDTVDVNNRLGGKIVFPEQHIIEPLNTLRRQLVHHHIPQVGFEMNPNMLFVGAHGGGLEIDGVVPQPDVQPLSYRDLFRFDIISVVDLRQNLMQLLLRILLGFAVDGLLDLPPGYGIKSH